MAYLPAFTQHNNKISLFLTVSFGYSTARTYTDVLSPPPTTTLPLLLHNSACREVLHVTTNHSKITRCLPSLHIPVNMDVAISLRPTTLLWQP